VRVSPLHRPLIVICRDASASVTDNGQGWRVRAGPFCVVALPRDLASCCRRLATAVRGRAGRVWVPPASGVVVCRSCAVSAPVPRDCQSRPAAAQAQRRVFRQCFECILDNFSDCTPEQIAHELFDLDLDAVRRILALAAAPGGTAAMTDPQSDAPETLWIVREDELYRPELTLTRQNGCVGAGSRVADVVVGV
jgi:hypothetical protein